MNWQNPGLLRDAGYTSRLFPDLELFIFFFFLQEFRMSLSSTSRFLLLCVSSAIFFAAGLASASEPLPSWNDGPHKQAIISFVTSVTTEGGADYVQPADRIAVFDNDGTLWTEQPGYAQLFFAVDRVRALAPQHPEWKTEEPFKSILAGDTSGLAASGKEGICKLLMATHIGMTTDEFAAIVSDWIRTATHPVRHVPYPEMVFQPMLELLQYLRENRFTTWIVSGGGIEFMRPWAEEVYGIPPEQVIGSSVATQFAMRDGKPVLLREAKLNFLDEKEGKPVGINRYIGKRPIFAFGNSDGDLQMLQWTTLSGKGKAFGGIVHHTDAEREYAYDRESHFGRLDKALVEADKSGWTVVDMKKDWKVIYQK